MASALFPGNSNYRLDLVTWRSGNTIFAQASVTKLAGSGYWTAAAQPWTIYIGGVPQGGSWTYDFTAYSTHYLPIVSLAVAPDTYWVQANVAMDGFGTASAGEYITVPSVPPPPNINCLSPNPDQITTNSMRLRFCSTGEGGSPVIQWDLQRATDAAFTQNVVTITSGGTSVVSGLAPGTTYYWRARGVNAIGAGGWSGTVSGTTLPSVPPGLSVTASASGLSAVANLSPPGGVSGVTSYVVERRLLGSGTATPYTTASPTLTVTGLTPGATYEWRASAWFGTTYQSPWSSWIQVIQPNPSTSPGDYFDGSTAATPDQTYSWSGTANNSTSLALGNAPLGWTTFAGGSGSSGGTGVVARVSDPRYGTFGARATFFTDATAAGFRLGTADATPGLADITSGTDYTGSLFVRLSRTQRVAAYISWWTGPGVLISTAVGTPLVTGTTWQRLSVTAAAPATAEWASVGVIDVSGAGWSLWKGGDTITADAAMVSLGPLSDYFDGSFADGGGFMYSWLDDPNASASIRENTTSDPADALVDPDCPPVPLPPRPPAIPDPCVEESGLWRRYYAIIPASEVSDWLDILPTFTLTTFAYAERQVRIRIYPNPFEYPVSQIDTENWCAEQIISYIPAHTTMTLDGELQRVFASVQGGGMVAADHLLYGTGGTPASWPVLSCGISYLVSFDTPVSGTAPPLGNVVPQVTLTRRT